MIKRLVSSVGILLCVSTFLWSQSGTNASFNFLNMGKSARLASMGWDYAAVMDDDITLSLSNPSLINANIDNHLALNYVNYFSGINYGFLSYAKNFKKLGSFAAHLQYANYGSTDAYNEYGDFIGSTSANDLALIIGWGRALNPYFSIGANFKFIYSQIDAYSALGVAVDVSASYSNIDKSFVASLLLRNAGTPLKNYHREGWNSMPFEIGFALSQKIPHAPFRLFLMMTNLQKWNLRYQDPKEEEDSFILTEQKKMSPAADFFDNALKHFVFGAELIPYKGFYLRISYNYLRYSEMSIMEKPGSVGLSWGVGVKLWKFNLSYARSAYHLVGSPNYLSLTLNLNAFK